MLAANLVAVAVAVVLVVIELEVVDLQELMLLLQIHLQ